MHHDVAWSTLLTPYPHDEPRCATLRTADARGASRRASLHSNARCCITIRHATFLCIAIHHGTLCCTRPQYCTMLRSKMRQCISLCMVLAHCRLRRAVACRGSWQLCTLTAHAASRCVITCSIERHCERGRVATYRDASRYIVSNHLATLCIVLRCYTSPPRRWTLSHCATSTYASLQQV